MPIDTYEIKTTRSPLETYEWDDIWWDHAPDKEGKRILIIGDSISRGYRRAAAKIENRDFYIDGIATSKAVDNTTFYTLLDYYAQSGLPYDAVFFNNGLHGWHLDDSEKFKAHFEKLAAYIKERFSPKSFYIVLTTPVRKSKQTEIFDERNERAKLRNISAAEVAEKLGAETVDLFSLIENRPDLYTQDGVHLVDEGYDLLANEILTTIKSKGKN